MGPVLLLIPSLSLACGVRASGPSAGAAAPPMGGFSISLASDAASSAAHSSLSLASDAASSAAHSFSLSPLMLLHLLLIPSLSLSLSLSRLEGEGVQALGLDHGVVGLDLLDALGREREREV
jgi:hypothetical protein